MRYCYHNRAYLELGARHGIEADPVRNRAGRCVVGPRHQLVCFEDQIEVVVVRRGLRLLSKCKIHGKDEQ